MRQAIFLWKNERGIYFFRARIPKQFSDYFNGPEIKKSLKTDSYRLAIKLARAYRVELDKEMEKLKGAYSAFEVTLTTKTDIILPNGEKRPVESKIGRNLASLDELPALREHFTKLHGNEVERQERRARDQALFEAQLATINTAPNQTPQQKTSALRPILLSELIQKYAAQKVADGKWQPDPKSSSHDQGIKRLSAMLEIIGDKQSTDLTELDALTIEETLPNVPKNPNKGDLAKLPTLCAKINTDPAIYPRLGKQTQSKYWELFKDFIKFARQKKHIGFDIVEDCRGIKFSKKEAKANRWRKFTDEDLQNIFNGYVYQANRIPRARYHDYHFWLPLLAAYTGARQNELCQLLLTDIKQYKNVWYFDITDEDEEGRKIDGKSIKSEAGKRKVPIHSKLIELGFVDFINQPRSGNNSSMVFSSGLSYSTKERWGKNASRWFNGYDGAPGYKHKCGIASDDRKVFHSFRKSFASNLINQTNVERLAQLIGHEQEYETTFIYVDEIELPVLKDVVEKLDYKIDLSHVRYDTFKGR